jgi:hypothetical protein
MASSQGVRALPCVLGLGHAKAPQISGESTFVHVREIIESFFKYPELPLFVAYSAAQKVTCIR